MWADSKKEVFTMLEQKYADAIKTKLSAVSVTSRTIGFILQHPIIHRGSVRVFTGNIYTDKEYSRLRKNMLKNLP